MLMIWKQIQFETNLVEFTLETTTKMAKFRYRSVASTATIEFPVFGDKHKQFDKQHIW